MDLVHSHKHHFQCLVLAQTKRGSQYIYQNAKLEPERSLSITAWYVSSFKQLVKCWQQQCCAKAPP